MITSDFFNPTCSFYLVIFLMKNGSCLYIGSICGADQSRIGIFAIPLARVEMISGHFTSSLFFKSKLLLNFFFFSKSYT